MSRVRTAAISAVAALLALAACGGTSSQPSATPTPDPVSGQLTVLAAASLTDAFNKIGSEFKAKHPNATPQFSFAGSPTLVTQILQGAPSDVFASADQPNMQKVVDGGQAQSTPRVFTTNHLQIVVQAGNPKGIKSVADLANPSLNVVVCAPAVPCGNYSKTVFTKAGVQVTPKSQEQDVKSVISKVSLGEADAGIVYTTDVQAGGKTVQGVDIPSDLNVTAQYPIVSLKATQNKATADAFVSFVLGSQGQKTLMDYGFGPPS